MNQLLKVMFQRRGLSEDDIVLLDQRKHTVPLHTDVLCTRLREYHDTGKLLVLYTDVDVDGIMCGVIGYAGLSELGFRVALYQPSTTCYGFQASDIDALIQQYPDVSGILTGDVGIGAYDGIAYAKEKGLDFFVTDHHKPSYPLPNADVIVDPMLVEDKTSYSAICGANVMYQVLRYYAEYESEQPGCMMNQIDRLRVFVGFGTISDQMPLLYENRQIVRDSITISRMMYHNGSPNQAIAVTGCTTYRLAFYGLYWLFEMFARAGKISKPEDINEDFFGYYLAPALNSIKRLGAPISLAYYLFFGGETYAINHMERILELNDERKLLVKEKTQEIHETIQPYSPYIFLTDAPSGVRGLIAQNLMSDDGFPKFVLAPDVLTDDDFITNCSYSGSGRCPNWFPFLDWLCDMQQQHSELVDTVWAGGHNYAFGCGVVNEDALSVLSTFVKLYVKTHAPKAEDIQKIPDIVISTMGDGDVTIDVDLFAEFLYESEYYRPFGVGFPSPQILLKIRKSDFTWRLIGSDNPVHVKGERSGFSVICFHAGDMMNGQNSILDACMEDELTIWGYLSFNEWNGIKSVQFIGSFESGFLQPEDLDVDGFLIGDSVQEVEIK